MGAIAEYPFKLYSVVLKRLGYIERWHIITPSTQETEYHYIKKEHIKKYDTQKYITSAFMNNPMSRLWVADFAYSTERGWFKQRYDLSQLELTKSEKILYGQV